MKQKPDNLRESPSQTAGPYVHIGCTPNFTGIDIYGGDLGTSMKSGPVQGTEITIKGTVFDGTDTPLRDAMIEIWQPDAAGLFPSANETRGTPDPNFAGWGRSPGDMTTGEFVFETVKPGAVPFPDGRMQAPHITAWIVCARHQYRPAYSHLFRRRSRGECDRPNPKPDRAPEPHPHTACQKTTRWQLPF